MITGNRGEWSEIYTLLKLLADGKLYTADEDLKKNENIYYDIIKIYRKENVGDLIFGYDDTGTNIRIIKENENNVLVPRKEFIDVADNLFKQILSAITPTFSIRDVELFLNKIQCSKLKAPSSDKTDIKMQVRDIKAGCDPILGFSIKSTLGSPSTLLNAGNTTNFTYKIIGNIDKRIIDLFNTTSNFTNKFDMLFSAGNDIEFMKIDKDTFSDNLKLIDSELANITALLMKEAYSSGNRNVKNALEELKIKNPLNYNLTSHPYFYEYKFKKLLAESALGMVPSVPWTGQADATGGYIVVREDGEVLCFHLYNRNEFENYLLNNTKFETASTTRYDFGRIFELNGNYYLKLNLQIRFIR